MGASNGTHNPKETCRVLKPGYACGTVNQAFWPIYVVGHHITQCVTYIQATVPKPVSNKNTFVVLLLVYQPECKYHYFRQ